MDKNHKTLRSAPPQHWADSFLEKHCSVWDGLYSVLGLNSGSNIYQFCSLCPICKKGILISTTLGCQIKPNYALSLAQSRHFHDFSSGGLGRLLPGVGTVRPLNLQTRMPAWPCDNLVAKAAGWSIRAASFGCTIRETTKIQKYVEKVKSILQTQLT